MVGLTNDLFIMNRSKHPFWSDGQVRVSGRDYNGMVESACYIRGDLTCMSCHTMHPESTNRAALARWADDQLKPGMRTNLACIQCHQEYRDDSGSINEDRK